MATAVPGPTEILAKHRVFIGSRWPEALTLVAYVTMLALIIPRHEPFADEAQAWQLARSVPIADLFRHYLRYEGSPGLWYLLLAFLSRLHVTYNGLHWFSGAVATVGVSLLIFFGPFPRFIRLTLPFTFFLAFQYAVVARSYVLVPLLLFAVAIVWRRSPIFVAVLLGLLANVAMHAFAISGGFAILYLIEHRKQERRTLLLAGFILLAFYAFALWTVFPHPSDLGFLLPFKERSGPLRMIWLWLADSVRSLCVGVAAPGFLAVFLWVLLLLLFRRAGRTMYLLPVAAFASFSGYHFYFWHAGLVIPTMIAICWIAWPDLRPAPWSALAFGTICFLALQVCWTLSSVTYYPYSAAPETARFLAPHIASGESIALTYIRPDIANAYMSVGLAPYFDKPIFTNQPRPFWLWSTKEHTFDQFREALDHNPSLVVALFNDSHRFDPEHDQTGPGVDLLHEHGYALGHTFCSEMPRGLGWHDEICYLIFERPRV
jgi:hypothetical protein